MGVESERERGCTEQEDEERRGWRRHVGWQTERRERSR